ncbi:TetR/AcrR family transcriptional regulator [Butyrivibrio sp. DSM 10294]|uniref:TetR/AcrR family transcriptional regulator n=1 Tax=Butyrivibrio sp. DSM 10294 TaxID=2972457 RepID=UPI00234F865A|nr:TetR/AcrR family transcriptional regulator [Butyrivibrio sp. DSM 10294]MDC7294320.1 TetR/AcrR family transcriptional regulator [Butyrivibrio sp. DSM 10294]
MGKAEQNKKLKMESLLNTSFELFTSKGLNKTSISDIVEKAGVAKGTFYLYFKDKYDIRNRLIAHKSSQLFMQAYHALDEAGIEGFEDRLIFIMDYVLDELAANKGLLAFIYKDLSWAVFKKALTTPVSSDDVDFGEVYRKMIAESGLNFKEPEVMLFLIIELVGSTGYSSIMYDDPVSLNDLKPHLETTVRSIIKQYTIQ